VNTDPLVARCEHLLVIHEEYFFSFRWNVQVTCFPSYASLRITVPRQSGITLF
jgi:hypothetical protein